MIKVPLNIAEPGLAPEIRLLLIHDECTSIEQLQEHVDMNSHRCRFNMKVATSGERAEELVNTWNPTVVVIDAYLDDVNSFELLEKFSSKPCPVIVTSSEHSTEIAESAIKHGAAAYIKSNDDPDNIEELLQQIARLAQQSIIRQ